MFRRGSKAFIIRATASKPILSLMCLPRSFVNKNSHISELCRIFALIPPMKVTFEDTELESLVLTHQSRKYKKYQRDSRFLAALDRVYDDLRDMEKTTDLRTLSYLHYERLKGVNMSSVRVMNGRVERLLFHEYDDGIEISLIEIDDTHYGQR